MDTQLNNNNINALTPNDEQDFPIFEDMGETEARAFKLILQSFIQSYVQKPKVLSTEVWLTQKLAEELPQESHEEIQSISREIISTITEFDHNLDSINEACNNGKPKEEWFEEKIKATCSGISLNDYGDYLANIDRTLHQTNEQMLRTVERHGECFNLDGFIAEQQHVNDFNTQAALENQNYRAYVQEPAIGKGYTKNSFDIVIKDNNGKIIHQYQSKFGKDATATIRLLKSGNYNNQRILVPTEQVEEVQKAFPDKTVTDHIGGTDKIPTKSKGLTKAEVKRQQLDAQEKNQIKDTNWNSYNTKKLALHLGKEAALTGMTAALYSSAFYLSKKVWAGEKIKAEEAVEVALKTGVDAGIKSAVAGALTVAVKRGLIPMLARSTPVGIIANIAAVGVENCKIIYKCAKGEISGPQAVDLMGRTTLSMFAGLLAAAEGAKIGAMIGSSIPVIGTAAGAVGGFVAGAVGYIAGSAAGEKIYNEAKTVAKTAKSFVESAYNGVKAVGSAICSGVKSVANAVSNAVTTVANTISNGVSKAFNAILG